MEFYGSTHCHTDRSNFRLRDSINSLNELCWYAADKLKHNFIAITDHETVSTFIDCQDAEKEIREKYPDFKIIRGNEIYLCRNGLNKENYKRGEDRFYHWILLAKDEIGNRQIRELSTRAWSRAFKQGKMIRVPTYYSDLEEIVGSDKGHVIMQQSCLGGRLSQLEVDYIKEPTEEKWSYIKLWVENIQKICGKENFFLEVQPARSKDQLSVYKATLKLQEETNIPVLISLDAHYLTKDDKEIHHAFLTSQEGDRETEEFYATTYMMSREEIHEIMDEAVGQEKVSEWMNNTKKVYDMCEDYDLKKPTRIVYLPKTIDHISEEEFLLYKDKIKELEYFYKSEFQEDRDLAAAIVRKILSDKRQYDNQETYLAIDDNLKAIRLTSDKMKTRWSAYLLNMRDYIKVIWEKGNSLVGCSRGCFYPKEKVLLSNGTEKNICDIKIGDKVFNHNGEINRVRKVYQYNIEEECYVIKGKGREPIHCTNNHEFYIKKCSSCENPIYKNNWCKETCRRSGKCSYEKSHEVGFVPANELRVGDLLAYPKPKLPPITNYIVDLADYIKEDKYTFIENCVVGYYVGNNITKKGKEVVRYLPLNEDLAYVCGVFIGDGWTRERGNEVGFVFNSANEKDHSSLKRCETFFTSLGLKVIKAKHPTKKIVQMRIYSKVFSKFFRANFGENTYDKHICNWLISSDTKISKALLLGLMASDGYYGKNKICYDTVNKQLIKQIQMLWASVGIYGNYKSRIPENKKWAISYKWTASGKQLKKIIKDFPLVNISEKKYTKQDYLEDDDCFYTIIESIKTEKYKGLVYDLNVENIHSYVINGASVHNSGLGFILLNILDITQVNPLREKTKTYSFRFLNPERVSPLDVDCDIEGGKRPQVYKALQDAYGEDRVSKVLTIKTEKARSAIQTAARGLKYPPEVGAHLSSFIKADRGQQRTLKQTFYGDADNKISPDLTFVDLMTNKYPDIWAVAQRIEGLCNGSGSHAGGVIFYDEPITNTTALMKTASGDVITQYDLHKLEAVSLLKIDLLSIEALDRIRACLDLLCEYGYLDGSLSLRERYEKAIGVYNLERNAPEMWKMVHEHKIQNLFQMEQESGIKGIEAVKPETVDELAALNAVIRLMPPEGSKEAPVEKFSRFKNNIEEWYNELRQWKVDKKYWPVLEKIVGITYGMCVQQEQFMMLVQQPELGDFNLLWSDKLRRSVAKKNPKAFEALEKEFFEITKEKQDDFNLCNYVWKVLIEANKGYGF